MKKTVKKALAIVLAVAALIGALPVAANATFLLIGAYPTLMWLTPLGLLAPVIWVAHKIVLALALITTPFGESGPLWEAVAFIRLVLYPMWGIIW